MKLDAPFIPLPYRFDAERMALEVGQFADELWVAHPNKIDGNTALPLISRGGGNNDEMRGGMKPTPYLEHCPYLQQVIASFDEVFGRSRLMRLAPGCEVFPHVDFHHHWHNHVRIHIPVFTNPDVTFYCGDAQIHMQAGDCWIFDSWRRHRVVNAGGQMRIHLVIDTAGSSRFWETVQHANQAVQTQAPNPARFVPYQPNRPVQIATERFNLQPVMAPGEVELLTHDLINDFEAVAENDRAGVALYKKIMLGFCKDWRALWYQYGIHKPGWRHYTRLVAMTSRSLPDLDPPLMVQNNKHIAAKAAFGGRVLAVALSRDVYDEFIGSAAAQSAAEDSAPTETPAMTESGIDPPPTTVVAAAPTLVEPGRNAPCHCGSGKRYKHCHGAAGL